MGRSGQRRGGRRRVGAVVAVVFVALVLAAIETLGRSSTVRPQGAADIDVAAAHHAVRAGSPVTVIDVDPASAPSTAADVDPSPSPASGSALPPPADPRGGPASAADPHRLVRPPGHTFDPAALPPDSTPLAAAAGTEPDSMAPLAGVPAGWASSVHRFRVGSMTRSYLMLRPKAASPTPLPVVVVLHGRNLTPASIERLTRMPQTTGAAIEVYPAGYGRSWNAGGCCGVAHQAGVNDVTFLTDVVHQVLSSQHDAAAGRVYLVGYSNGGRMAYRMACAAPGMWAGIAAVEAVPVAECPSVPPVPIIVVASSHDPLLTINDGQPRKAMQGYLQPTVQTTVDQWRHLDGCTPAGGAQVTGTAAVDTWSHCQGAGRVAYALYHGGSHAWPGGTTGAPRTPSAEDLLWSWLQHGTVVTAAAA